MSDPSNLFLLTREALLLTEPEQKSTAVTSLHARWLAGELHATPMELADVTEAGCPQQVLQVVPGRLAKRGMGSVEGRAALIHAVTHIEFSAINLALDAVFRFQTMPIEFFGDWLQVAAEEVEHFNLLAGRLHELGYAYGAFPVHQGLWQQASRTAHDPLIRMAIVPRVLEARGLDVTPGMIERFRQAGDPATAAMLEIILRDEVGHVEAGSRWFHHLCNERGLESEQTYFQLLSDYMEGSIRCPLHRQARLQAGFSTAELAKLEALCAEQR